MVELRSDDAPSVTLVHPYPSRYRDLFQVVSQELSIPFVPYSEWIEKLEKAAGEVAESNDATRSAQFAEQVPAATIIAFFKSAVSAVENGSEGHEAMGLADFETDVARKGSAALRNARKLVAEDVQSWLGYWKSVEFLV